MAEMTERLLIDAGIGPGMRVLDVGCGRGDVALLGAKLVGAHGEVVGIDRDLGALQFARGRVRETGTTNVTFVAGDFAAMLMGLGALASVAAARPANLHYVVLDNDSHASTGGQRTISNAVPLERATLPCGYGSAVRADRAETLGRDLDALFSAPFPRACW